MSTHLCAFYNNTYGRSLSPITTIVDDVLTRPSTDRFQVPSEKNAIHWAYAACANLTRAQIDSPSLQVRRMTLDIVPHRRGYVYMSPSAPEAFIPKREILLTPTENFQLLGSDDASANAALFGLISLKSPGALPEIPAGDIREIRATASVTLTANTWTTLTPTLEHDLEPGTYALVGFIPISAHCIAARAIFTGQPWRPGVPGLYGSLASVLDHEWNAFDPFMWYNMGQFTHINPPQFQFLADTADTSETIILFVVKLS